MRGPRYGYEFEAERKTEGVFKASCERLFIEGEGHTMTCGCPRQ